MDARPTEYKGIRYRSKSEAMFARWLEMVVAAEFDFPRLNCGGRCGSGGFIYEPRFLAVGEWVPDFFRWSVVASKDSFPTIYGTAIEYKPSKPTVTYLIEFERHCKDLSEVVPYPCAYELYYGGFYENDPGLILWDFEHGIHDAPSYESNWIGDLAAEIMATRFDLEVE